MTEDLASDRGRALMRHAWDLFAASGILALAMAVVAWGCRGPVSLPLNLGPGDAPFIRGFLPEYEIDEKVATQWSLYDAALTLPLELDGGPLALVYRAARVLPETAVVEVDWEGRMIDRFTCRGGHYFERRVELGAVDRRPAAVHFRIDSHDRKGLGLKMDWLKWELGSRAHTRLAGRARWRLPFVLVLLFLLHRLMGWSTRSALGLTAPWLLALLTLAHKNVWLAFRLMDGIPLALLVFGVGIALVGTLLRLRGLASPRDVECVGALMLAAFLLRAGAVNHPAFYYPDQRTHARLVGVLQSAGSDFFVHPAHYIWEHGVWRTEAYGRTYAFPYTPAFHLPFAPWNLTYDRLLLAMKLGAAAVSTVPIALLWALARTWGASPFGAVLLLFLPTYTSRLGFAFFPALFGHVFDLALLLWWARTRGSPTRSTWIIGAAAVSVSQLAYISGVLNVGMLVACLVVAEGVADRTLAGRRRVWRLLTVAAAGSALSVVLYYRDFIPMMTDVLARVAGGVAEARPRYPVQSWLLLAYARTHDFFDGVYPVLALLGLILLWKRRAARTTMAAWLGAYALLLLGRAKVPDIFLHGHETLLLTPFVALAAGECVAFGASARRKWVRGIAAAVVIGLAIQGMLCQWRAIAEQLGNAR